MSGEVVPVAVWMKAHVRKISCDTVGAVMVGGRQYRREKSWKRETAVSGWVTHDKVKTEAYEQLEDGNGQMREGLVTNDVA